jgi:ornithine cyclodeaminase/alanine dehydrogenase-like protein (mu-crystallin family)
MVLFLSEADVLKVLTVEEAVAVLEATLRDQGLGRAVSLPRQQVRTERGLFHLKAGATPGWLGFKAYTIFAGGERFHCLLFDGQTGELRAVIQADHLGRLRTGAAGAVAARHLARPDADRAAIFGSGRQAEAQLIALAATRKLREVRVFSPNPNHRSNFAARMSARLGIPVVPAADPAEAAAGADIIVTATTSPGPVVQGAWLRAGCHVNVIGATGRLRRELDVEAWGRADRIFVDSVEQCRLDSGDLLAATEAGVVAWEAVAELGWVVAGLRPGRRSDAEITVFRAGGLGLWDVAVAARVYELARARGLGREINL